MFELIEWRAVIYAFQRVETRENPFNKYTFHAQWLMGGTYTIFCLLGKIVSKNDKDNSLINLWERVSAYILPSGYCNDDEFTVLINKMSKKDGYFRNKISKSMLVRNKMIAHNEEMPKILWENIDKDIEVIARAWGLITMWSSRGVIPPFRDDKKAFSGLENVLTEDELKKLLHERRCYIDQFCNWCVSSIVTGEKVGRRTPFINLSISVKAKKIKI